MNLPDDLFMFLKRRLGTDDGIVPGQKYRITYTMVFASSAPSGAAGIGGAPGESVFIKAQVPPRWNMRYTLILLPIITS